ncbi:MAG: molecular chaperone TorD family protein [Desulfuromonadales bacterium]
MLHISERKRLYTFFALLFSYPDQELIDFLQTGEGRETAALLPEAPPRPAGSFTLRALEIAYTGLFLSRLGGVPAPLYGSVYLERDRQLMGETTRQVAAAYRGEGLALEGNSEPPDHLATELEFLYYLVEQEEASLARRDLTAARAARSSQREFCQKYLHPWMAEFRRRVEEDAEAHPLYRWGARLLEDFCRLERDWLEKSA